MRWKRRIGGVLAVAGLVLATVGVGVGSADTAERSCQTFDVPLDMVGQIPPDVTVHAELCLPEGAAPSAVQLLQHGFTYDHNYWDQPGFQGRYSYAQAANAAGYATLNIDLLGNGKSTTPFGLTLGLDAHVEVAHQMIRKLRQGWFTTPDGQKLALEKVVSVGHSYGSGVAFMEASRHKDVDGLVLTGVNHFIDYGFVVTQEVPRLVPAILDPKWLGKTLDPAYLTTQKGARYDLFMAPGDVDPALVEQEEQLKGTLTLREVAEMPLALAAPLDVQAPVLLAQGDQDPLFCGAGVDCSSPAELVEKEAPKLGPEVPCVEGYLQRGGGHSNVFMRTAPEFFDALTSWSQRHVPAQRGQEPQACAGATT